MISRFSRAVFFMFVTGVAMLAISIKPVSAACTINVFVENVGDHRIWVRNEFIGGKGTAVRGGVGWRALSVGNWRPSGIPDSRGGPFFGLNKGQRVGDGYDTALACNVRRQFQVEFRCDGGPNDNARFVRYYPAVDAWTPQSGTDIVNIQLGNKCN